jgi:hypothetical protein
MDEKQGKFPTFYRYFHPTEKHKQTQYQEPILQRRNSTPNTIPISQRNQGSITIHPPPPLPIFREDTGHSIPISPTTPRTSSVPSHSPFPPPSTSSLALDTLFSEEPKCHITDFIVQMFTSGERANEELRKVGSKFMHCRTFQLFGSRCWVLRCKLDTHNTSHRFQTFLDNLQHIHHSNLATPAAHFPTAGYYYTVYPLYFAMHGITRRDKYQLWDALCALHAAGMRHGDVHLRNVMRDGLGNALWIHCESAMHVCEITLSHSITTTHHPRSAYLK